jgi:lysophospholipase L1-like esterase
MKKAFKFIVCLLIIFIFTGAKPETHLIDMPKLNYTFLSLGDSYTIGESVLPQENFPNQTVKLLNKVGYEFASPEIIAKTGWTTDELQTAINAHTFLPKYDFVTLLIGVNNQYRGRTVENYKSEFEILLKQAIQFAENNTNHVIVLSVPDWGSTPFAEGRDRNKITKEIDEYNSANKMIADKFKVHYINITPGTREAANDNSLLAADRLHPSAKEYQRWADQVSAFIKNQLQ